MEGGASGNAGLDLDGIHPWRNTTSKLPISPSLIFVVPNLRRSGHFHTQSTRCNRCRRAV